MKAQRGLIIRVPSICRGDTFLCMPKRWAVSKNDGSAIRPLRQNATRWLDIYLVFSSDKVKAEVSDRVITGNSAGSDFGLKQYLALSNEGKVGPNFSNADSGRSRKPTRTSRGKRRGRRTGAGREKNSPGYIRRLPISGWISALSFNPRNGNPVRLPVFRGFGYCRHEKTVGAGRCRTWGLRTFSRFSSTCAGNSVLRSQN